MDSNSETGFASAIEPGWRRRFRIPWPVVKRLAALLGTTLIVWLLLRQIRLTDIWQLLVQADARWLAAGFGWYLFTNILRSYRFAALMGIPGVLKPVCLLPEMIALSFLNNVLPARSGELSFPYLMQKQHQTPVGDSLTFLLIARIFDLLSVAALFVVFAFRERPHLEPTTGRAMMGVSLLILPILAVLAVLPWLGASGFRVGRQVLRHLRVTERRWGQWLFNQGRQMVGAMSHVHRGRTYGRALFWSVLGWLTTFAWFSAFLQAIHMPVRYPLVVVGAALATLSKAVPFITAGGFGAHEAGWAVGFRLVGMPLETAIASGFAVNILTLLASFIFTGLAFGYRWVRGMR